MNNKSIIDELIKIDLNQIDFTNEQNLKNTFVKLFNLIEHLAGENQALKIENQALKDEINRLKGEKGKPDIKGNAKDKKKNIKLAELEKGKKIWNKGTKIDKIKVDKEEIIQIDKSKLPQDAEFKGYHTHIIQNVKIETDNTLYKLESYYSASEGKTYTAELPEYLKNTEFGPELKAFVHMLYFDCRVTEHKITEILNSNGIKISEGTISNILIKEKVDELTEEKKEIFEAGLESSEYHQIDDTGMRVDGENNYATILCNESYSAYFIRRYKNRETVNKILCGVDENEEIDMEKMKTLVKILISDDAPQFKKITEYLGLCWIHEERHYEKMMPVVEYHKKLLEKVITEIWDYYSELKLYKVNPYEEDKNRLSFKFDEIFTQVTGYEALDARLQLTYNKKENLLLVLKYPQIPLHNNLSEIGERTVVIKRKISGGVRNNSGKIAWENGLTILATCKKHTVNFYSYIRDIFAGCSNRLHLSDLILEKNSTTNKFKDEEFGTLLKTA
jgi:hypothetical protein